MPSTQNNSHDVEDVPMQSTSADITPLESVAAPLGGSGSEGAGQSVPPTIPAPESPWHFWKQAALLVACSLSIYVCFIGYGLLQERMYTNAYGEEKEKFRYSLFLVFVQCIGNAAFAVFFGIMTAIYHLFFPKKSTHRHHGHNHHQNHGHNHHEHQRDSQPSPTAFMSMSFSYIGAMYCSNWALSFMSYPAQALAKSCKLIPVMLARIILMGKRYSLVEYLQVVCITLGICVFMLGDQKGGGKHGGKEHPETSWIGLGLCCVSLILDGYTGPAQEKLNHKHKISMATMMFWINFWAFCLVGVVLVGTGEMWTGSAFCLKHLDFLRDASTFALLSALGQASILFTLICFNSLVVVTVTTTRKFFTILFSVVLYGHTLAGGQWLGVALVFLGLSVDVYTKYQSRHDKKNHKAAAPKAS